MKILSFVLILIIVTGCSYKYDGFDPTTATFRWIVNHELERQENRGN